MIFTNVFYAILVTFLGFLISNDLLTIFSLVISILFMLSESTILARQWLYIENIILRQKHEPQLEMMIVSNNDNEITTHDVLGVIIIKNGISIFSEFFSPTIRTDIDLTGALLSAIESFASEAGGSQLEALKFKDFKIHMQKRNGLGFILFSRPETEEAHLQTLGRTITEKFFESFTRDDILKHAYTPRHFEQFSETLRELLRISPRHVTRPISFFLYYNPKNNQFKFIDLFQPKDQLEPFWEHLMKVLRTFINRGGYLTGSTNAGSLTFSSCLTLMPSCTSKE